MCRMFRKLCMPCVFPPLEPLVMSIETSMKSAGIFVFSM